MDIENVTQFDFLGRGLCNRSLGTRLVNYKHCTYNLQISRRLQKAKETQNKCEPKTFCSTTQFNHKGVLHEYKTFHQGHLCFISIGFHDGWTSFLIAINKEEINYIWLDFTICKSDSLP